VYFPSHVSVLPPTPDLRTNFSPRANSTTDVASFFGSFGS
jgi:hypothetical protein